MFSTCFLLFRFTVPNEVQLPQNFLMIFSGPKGDQEASKRGRGPHKPTGRALMACGRPSGLPTPLFSYMVCFTLEKNHKITFGTKRRRLEAENWADARLHSGSQILPGKSLSGRGRSKPSSSPTLPLSWEDQSSSTSSPAPSHLQP